MCLWLRSQRGLWDVSAEKQMERVIAGCHVVTTAVFSYRFMLMPSTPVESPTVDFSLSAGRKPEVCLCLWLQSITSCCQTRNRTRAQLCVLFSFQHVLMSQSLESLRLLLHSCFLVSVKGFWCLIKLSSVFRL